MIPASLTLPLTLPAARRDLLGFGCADLDVLVLRRTALERAERFAQALAQGGQTRGAKHQHQDQQNDDEL